MKHSQEKKQKKMIERRVKGSYRTAIRIIKSIKKSAMLLILEICNKIWVKEWILKDWKIAIILSMWKKVDDKNYTIITYYCYWEIYLHLTIKKYKERNTHLIVEPLLYHSIFLNIIQCFCSIFLNLLNSNLIAYIFFSNYPIPRKNIGLRLDEHTKKELIGINFSLNFVIKYTRSLHVKKIW